MDNKISGAQIDGLSKTRFSYIISCRRGRRYVWTLLNFMLAELTRVQLFLGTCSSQINSMGESITPDFLKTVPNYKIEE